MDKAEDCRVLRVVPEEGYGEGIFRIADIRTNSIGYASLRRYQSYTRAPADLVCLVARRARNLHSPEKFIRSLNTEGHRKHVNSFLRGFSIPSRESRRDTPESYLGTFAFSFLHFSFLVGWSRAFSPGMVDFPRAHKRSNLSRALWLLIALIVGVFGPLQFTGRSGWAPWDPRGPQKQVKIVKNSVFYIKKWPVLGPPFWGVPGQALDPHTGPFSKNPYI